MERTFTNTARREQIVRAAIDTLAELGYAKASFTRITERAGLRSPRMISYHFSDKDDLIRQIATEVLTEAMDFIVARVRGEHTTGGKLRAYLESNLEYLREHPREFAALTAIGPHLRDEGGKPYTSQTAQEPSVQGLEALLAEGQRTGEFRDFDPRSMAVIIRGAIEAAGQRLRGEPGLDFDAYTREVVATFTLATASSTRSRRSPAT
ncbi:MAG TPA: TetR/AcrR family transcriptional regulator [Stackebrandtia sp.]|jgi:AcrR family transcriptional regulator|uniref:TetR/AcrR family transcriptional regulator n=1 Tax=Stackebrandtia sp. TaxID=2023065 RepID=UPI002D618B32|nr:TetR/AcrR family transcriptional regulator [Stackebrandtia sp.]HZE41026.1 TetR/AcrR family transcriptional regulator [Stackebrandtia sp.]